MPRESRFMVVAAPQVVLLLVLTLVGLSLTDTVRVLIWAGLPRSVFGAA